MINKEEFIKSLSRQGFLWSYDPAKVTLLPDEIIIEQTLIYADTHEIQTLFKIYDPKTIKKVWKKNLLPDTRYRKLNYFLAKFFFNYKNPNTILNVRHESRLEKLQSLVAQNT